MARSSPSPDHHRPHSAAPALDLSVAARSVGDVPTRWSCRTGICHACEAGLVVGTATYDPRPIDEPADGDILVCWAVPEEDLVIDL